MARIERHGRLRWTSCYPSSVTALAWAMSGGFPISAMRTEEVDLIFSSFYLVFLLVIHIDSWLAFEAFIFGASNYYAG